MDDLPPKEFVSKMMAEVQADFRKQVRSIIKKYPNDFIEGAKIIVHVPTPDRYHNLLDNACISALRMFCPDTEMEIRHVKGLSWGIEDLELTHAGHEMEEKNRRQELPTDLELIRQFYHEVAESYWPDIVAERKRLAGE